MAHLPVFIFSLYEHNVSLIVYYYDIKTFTYLVTEIKNHSFMVYFTFPLIIYNVQTHNTKYYLLSLPYVLFNDI